MVTFVVLVSSDKLKIVDVGGTFQQVTQPWKMFWFLEFTFPSSLLLFAVMQGLCGITKLVGQKDMVLFLSVIIRYYLFCTTEHTEGINQWTILKGGKSKPFLGSKKKRKQLFSRILNVFRIQNFISNAIHIVITAFLLDAWKEIWLLKHLPS